MCINEERITNGLQGAQDMNEVASTRVRNLCGELRILRCAPGFGFESLFIFLINGSNNKGYTGCGACCLQMIQRRLVRLVRK